MLALCIIWWQVCVSSVYPLVAGMVQKLTHMSDSIQCLRPSRIVGLLQDTQNSQVNLQFMIKLMTSTYYTPEVCACISS